MAVNLCPVLNWQQSDANSVILANGTIETYLAGSSTPATTYKDAAGSVAHSNPIVLNTRGEPDSLIYLTAGIAYKFIRKDGSGNVIGQPMDNIRGINDVTATLDQWIASGFAPTYISAISFSLVGDQTSNFHSGRRLKLTTSGGTIYATITNSVYTSLTTVTVVNDSGVLDAGLSAVSYGLLSFTNNSLPKIIETEGAAVTAATTTDIWATDGNTRHVTGNTTITSFGTAPQAGARMKLIFDGTPLLTQGANLNLNGGGDNIQIEAEDSAEVYADTTTQLRVVVDRKSGLPVINNAISILNTSVSVSDTGTDGKITHTVDGVVISEETDTSRTSTIDGGTALIPEFKVRAWCVFDGTTAGTNAPTAGGNITNITRNATGDYTLNFTTALPDGNYEVSGSGTAGTTSAITVNIAAAGAGSAPTTKSTTQVRVYVGNSSGGVDCKQITIKVVR